MLYYCFGHVLHCLNIFRLKDVIAGSPKYGGVICGCARRCGGHTSGGWSGGSPEGGGDWAESSSGKTQCLW